MYHYGRNLAVNCTRSANRDRHGTFRPGSRRHHTRSRYHADDAGFRISDPGRNAARHRQGPRIIAVLVYAIPPVIRLTDLGIRLVDRDVLEAATAFGATRRQRLIEVQLPLAADHYGGRKPDHHDGARMVVIASMIGVKGLGQPVLKSITNQYFTMGLLNGLAIVAIAIMFDRVSQAYARRTQRHLKGVEHD